MFFCKCGRLPTELKEDKICWLCPCGKGYTKGEWIEKDLAIARAVQKAVVESLFDDAAERLTREILERL